MWIKGYEEVNAKGRITLIKFLKNCCFNRLDYLLEMFVDMTRDFPFCGS